MKPLCIDLCSGLGGWAEGFLSEGWDVIGFDIERHDYGTGGYPGQLVLQDVLTLHGSQFRNAAVIVASPPCQAYSYRAMPWKRAKALPPPDNTLFEACFRIQREANEERMRWTTCKPCDGTGMTRGCCRCEVCNGKGFVRVSNGNYIPLIVENVKGAQTWVGRASWHYGSFYLWGDVPALMPPISSLRKSHHVPLVETPLGTDKTSWFFGNSKHEGRHYGMPTKNDGGSWFAVAHNTESGHGQNPVNGRKGEGGGWFGNYQEMKAAGRGSMNRVTSSRSLARKAVSAQIAKIPFPLAQYIAQVFKPSVANKP